MWIDIYSFIVTWLIYSFVDVNSFFTYERFTWLDSQLWLDLCFKKNVTGHILICRCHIFFYIWTIHVTLLIIVTWLMLVRVTSHVTHTNEYKSSYTHKWVTSHKWASHVTPMNDSCPHTWMSHVTQMGESCHTYEWLMPTHMNESCHTYEC